MGRTFRRGIRKVGGDVKDASYGPMGVTVYEILCPSGQLQGFLGVSGDYDHVAHISLIAKKVKIGGIYERGEKELRVK
jgi:hypothetical protein